MKVHIDYERCRGHGQCAGVAPDIFEVREDDRAHLLIDGADVPSDDREAVADAVAMCPEGAITIEP